MGNEVKKRRSNSTLSLRHGKVRTKLQQQKRCFSPIKSVPAPVKSFKWTRASRGPPALFFSVASAISPSFLPSGGGGWPGSSRAVPTRRSECLWDNLELGMLRDAQGCSGQRLHPAQLAHCWKVLPFDFTQGKK